MSKFFRHQQGSTSAVDDGVLETGSSIKVDLSTRVNEAKAALNDTETQAEERRLRRKFDWLLLPPLTIMCVLAVTAWQYVRRCLYILSRYLCNALDKGNVGNAKTDGWDKVCSFLVFRRRVPKAYRWYVGHRSGRKSGKTYREVCIRVSSSDRVPTSS